MSGHLWIEPGQLVTASYEWRDHADTLDGAVTRTADAPTTGFATDDVGSAAASFIGSWTTLVGSLRDTSREFEDRMLDASTAYSNYDSTVQQQFETWLREMGQDA